MSVLLKCLLCTILSLLSNNVEILFESNSTAPLQLVSKQHLKSDRLTGIAAPFSLQVCVSGVDERPQSVVVDLLANSRIPNCLQQGFPCPVVLNLVFALRFHGLQYLLSFNELISNPRVRRNASTEDVGISMTTRTDQ